MFWKASFIGAFFIPIRNITFVIINYHHEFKPNCNFHTGCCTNILRN